MRISTILLLLLLSRATQQQEFFPHTITLDGRLTGADHERLLEREFEVPLVRDGSKSNTPCPAPIAAPSFT